MSFLMYWFNHRNQTLVIGACFVHDRVTKTSARGAEGPERIKDAADWGRHTDDISDTGQTSGQRHSPGGTHTWEEGPVPQACRVPGHQPGKESHKSCYTLNICAQIHEKFKIVVHDFTYLSYPYINFNLLISSHLTSDWSVMCGLYWI